VSTVADEDDDFPVSEEERRAADKVIEEYEQERERRLRVLEEILPQIATIARIPESQRMAFYRALPGRHGYAWAQDQRLRAGAEFPRDGALVRACRAMRAASKALGELNEKEQKRLKLALSVLNLDDAFLGDAFAENAEECLSIATTLTSALAWATGNERQNQQPLTERRRGRRKSAHFHAFVHRLLWAVEKFDGKLPFDRKKGDSEPLVRVIYLLKPLLPEGFLPNVPRLSTIERAANDYRKNPRWRAQFEGLD